MKVGVNECLVIETGGWHAEARSVVCGWKWQCKEP